MVQFLKTPDLIIYLKAETDTLISRIKNRNRNFEKEIDIEYLHTLNIAYDIWINDINDIKILKNTLHILTFLHQELYLKTCLRFTLEKI